MDIQTYLKRIAYDKPASPDIETLSGLHFAHFLSIPFENLDIRELDGVDHLGTPFSSLSERSGINSSSASEAGSAMN